MEELQKENTELKNAIKELTIQKNRLEDKLYRAFRKCLNTKKQKICELQKELDRLKRDGDKNNNNNNSKNSKPMVVDNEEEKDSQETDFEEEHNSSETDVDESDDIIFPVTIKEGDSNKRNVAENIIKDNSQSMDVDDYCGSSSKASSSKPGPSTSRVNAAESESDDDDEGLAFPVPKDIKTARDRIIKEGSLSPKKSVTLVVSPETSQKDNSQGSNSDGSKYDMDELISDL